jgi:gluconolactonase
MILFMHFLSLISGKSSLLSAIGLVIGSTVLVGQQVERFVVDQADKFDAIVDKAAKVELLADGFRFTEGPVWLAEEGGYLVFSDIPADRLYRWDSRNGVTVFREPSANTNGNLLDLQGRILSCEHGSRKVTVRLSTGKQVVVVDEYQGGKFNSPNDIAVRSDGTLWFTDPSYGLGNREKEQDGNYVYRYDPVAKLVRPIATDFVQPNGICFSPDESKLFVADSGGPAHIRVFNVHDQDVVSGGEVFCKIDIGGPDGIRCDAKGRIFSSAGDGVHIFDADGSRIGKILTPQSPANLCFGGKDGKTLFMTCRTGLYSFELK